MKVLVVTGIFPPDSGGPASYVPFISEAILNSGNEITSVVTLSDNKADGKPYNFPVVRIQRNCPWLFRAIKTIMVISKLAKKSDVVYLNGLVLEGVIACKIFSKKSVVIKVVGDLIWEKARNKNATKLNLDDFQQAKRLKVHWSFLKKLQSFYMRLADAIVVPSFYLGQIVQQWGVDSGKINVVYNAISITHKCLESPKRSYKYDLVTVARLVPWKGLTELIDLVSEIGCSLLIVGDGPLRKLLERHALTKKAKVSFTGNIPHSEVSKRITSAKAFVLNSSYEGLPHIILEAKASCTPVIASAAGGTVETITHGLDGWLVPVGDKEKLKEGVLKLLNDSSLRESLSSAGFDQINSNFKSSIQIESTIAVLKNACGQ